MGQQRLNRRRRRGDDDDEADLQDVGQVIGKADLLMLAVPSSPSPQPHSLSLLPPTTGDVAAAAVAAVPLAYSSAAAAAPLLPRACVRQPKWLRVCVCISQSGRKSGLPERERQRRRRRNTHFHCGALLLLSLARLRSFVRSFVRRLPPSPQTLPPTSSYSGDREGATHLGIRRHT